MYQQHYTLFKMKIEIAINHPFKYHCRWSRLYLKWIVQTVSECLRLFIKLCWHTVKVTLLLD